MASALPRSFPIPSYILLRHKLVKHLLLTLIILLCGTVSAVAQSRLIGRVVDSKTGEELPYVNVLNPDGTLSKTDLRGRFTLPRRGGKVRLSVIGYETQTLTLKAGLDSLTIRLKSMESSLGTATVTGRKKKYSRKDNPAVELMRKVIEAKKGSNLRQHDYYSIRKYTRTTMAFNDVTDKVFEEGKFKKLPFLKDYVKTCNETGKLILPFNVTEVASRLMWRKEPRADKTRIEGERTEGLSEFFSTGDLFTGMLKDCFRDVDIYQDRITLLLSSFTSPIATHGAISFYRYFIIDTLMVDGQRCIHLEFTPNNAQDVGFDGSLYVSDDSTYRVVRTDIGVPRNTGLNFVENMRVIQDFKQLPSGEQFLTSENMLVELKLVKVLTKFMVKRETQYDLPSFAAIPNDSLSFEGSVHVERGAKRRTDEFWAQRRPDAEEHTEQQNALQGFLAQIAKLKGFKSVLWIAKAFIENFVETSTDPQRPSKVDIGPINTMLTHNFVDGFRVRASAQTTANFNKHLFLKGYVAYGFKDKKVKGMGEVTYSFNEKEYLPREFPVNNLTFNYTRDVMVPSDKFLPTDKDNVFTSFKWTDVRHMMYYETYRLLWDREWENNLRINLQGRTSKDTPTADLFYQPLSRGSVTADRSHYISWIRTYDFSAGLTYQPGTDWINTKQRRLPTNHNAPIYALSHTVGGYELGTRRGLYNLTEATLYQRVWLGSWGRMQWMFKGGVQWNKVPYPLLIMPAANLSYIVEDNMFELVNNMEFLNDRYVSMMYGWDLNGKLFNRIPLFRRLKWREYLGCNVLWGTLTDKNNPLLPANAGDNTLLHFPGSFDAAGTFTPLTHVMDKKKPYVEVVAGVHNIFKLLHVEYVRRLTYKYPGTQLWGIRVMMRVTF